MSLESMMSRDASLAHTPLFLESGHMRVLRSSVSPELIPEVALAQCPQLWREGGVESQEPTVEEQHLSVPGRHNVTDLYREYALLFVQDHFDLVQNGVNQAANVSQINEGAEGSRNKD